MDNSSKKKTAILFCYNGIGFNGSQIQTSRENVRTVEAELQEALLKAKCMSPENYGFLNKIKWSRASRTDKGVHALCSVIGLKMLWAPKSTQEIIEEINTHLPQDLRIIDLKPVAASFNAKISPSYREYYYFFPYKFAANTDFSQEIIEKLNSITDCFNGTHSFHNYTREIKPNTPQSKRYIIKFKVDQSLVSYENHGYIKFIITGQSFLYHQIRKMIGISLAVFLGRYSIEDIKKSFGDEEFLVPLAPAEGLCLGKVHFNAYNKKQSHRPVEINEKNNIDIQEFFDRSIMPTIHSSYDVFGSWINSDLVSK